MIQLLPQNAGGLDKYFLQFYMYRHVFTRACIYEGMYLRGHVFTRACIYEGMYLRGHVFTRACIYEGVVA